VIEAACRFHAAHPSTGSADSLQGRRAAGGSPALGDSKRGEHPLEHYEVGWSGAMERAGLCPGLSRYQGHSDLHRAMRLAQQRAAGPIAWSEDRFVA
jgi:hypothetical protein